MNKKLLKKLLKIKYYKEMEKAIFKKNSRQLYECLFYSRF
jgi:hypothetical protein